MVVVNDDSFRVDIMMGMDEEEEEKKKEERVRVKGDLILTTTRVIPKKKGRMNKEDQNRKIRIKERQ